MIRVNALVTVAMLAANCAIGCVGPSNSSPQNESSWQAEFGLSERNLVPTGRNQYFILEPGFRLVLEGKTGFFGMNYEELAITVLAETKTVNGIITRVVEEREWKNGELIEVSRNFFAIDERTMDIFYFGEDVNMYKDEKLVKQ